MPYAIKANKIPKRIPSNDAWTISIGALKIKKSIKDYNLLKEKPPENQGLINALISY
tara:strand:+ start:241 stop:411 length:171 start_codon:yes stop_codon:yes gene_type:complete